MSDLRQCSRSFLTEFISLYKSFPCLWKTDSKDYRDRNKKASAYDVLVNKYEEVDPLANRETVTKKINSLRSVYNKEIKKVKKSQESGEEYSPSLWYYDHMGFLSDDHVTMTKSSVVQAGGGDTERATREVIDENDDQSDLLAVSPPPSSANMTLSTPQPSSNEFRSRCSPRKRQAPPPQADGIGNVTIVKVQSVNDDPREKQARNAPPLTREIGTMAAAEEVESPPSTNGVLTTMAAKKLDSVNEDPFDTYGKHIADRLRKISPDQIKFVQKLISDVLFEGEMKSLSRNCRIIDTELEKIP